MTSKHDVIRHVLINVKVPFNTKIILYGTVYNRIILATFYYFALLKIPITNKNLEQTTYTNQLFKKKCKILQVWKLRPRAAT